MAIPSFSAFHDEGINLEGLLEILSPENNLVLADDMMVSDGNGIILRVSETYEKNFGFAHHPLHYGGGHPATEEDQRHTDHQPHPQKRDDRGHSPV